MDHRPLGLDKTMRIAKLSLTDCPTRALTTCHLLTLTLLAGSLALPTVTWAARDGIYESMPLANDRAEQWIQDSAQLGELFRRRGMLYGTPDQNHWLNGVGARIAPEPTDPYIDYRFFMLRDPSPNAFALPDGQIYVHTGMLARLNDEAQLLALLAHEVNHVAGHHSLMQTESAHKKEIASSVVSGVLLGASLDFAGDFADLADLLQNQAFALSILGYSRHQEREADIKGFERLRTAGYDVSAMAELFDIFAEDPEGVRAATPTKWSTHPSLTERAEYLRSLTKSVPASELAQMRRGEEPFRHFTRSIAMMTIGDYLRVDYPLTAIALVEQLTRQFGADAELLALKGEAWHELGPRPDYGQEEATSREKRHNQRQRIRRTREERWAKALKEEEGPSLLEQHLAVAEQHFLDALSLKPNHPAATRGLAEVYETQGRIREAANSYLLYLKTSPDAIDHALVMSRAKALAEKLREQNN